MIWDQVSPVYDAFEMLLNYRVYSNTGKAVAEEIEADDIVLECACGTGAISQHIAPKCRMLIATDLSEGMLRQAYEKCSGFGNVKIRRADLMHLKCKDARFDKVVAGNVIHLLDEPENAIRELLRVCKPGGEVILPTYIRDDRAIQKTTFALLEKIGVHFNHEFDLQSYKQFFLDAGYPGTDFRVVEGFMPCAIAVITKE
ncbi:MAG: class I SAM-dependent methyltransferase [Oscillospiraceae bacterium]|nr:class I SAM-dependent methyltransferase [Oscillospiraceae bacterium]